VFREGREKLDGGRVREATGFFKAAITFDEQDNGRCRDPRYLSYYGYCLSLTGSDRRGGLRNCRHAVRLERHCYLIWWNMARVALMCGKRGEAFRSLKRALALHPTHQGIERELRQLGTRRPPVFTFLGRGNAINVLLGKMRGSVTTPVPSGAGRATGDLDDLARAELRRIA
jgi:hypothetical protein